MNKTEENFKFKENKSNLKISFELSHLFFLFFVITVILKNKNKLKKKS